ncbi:MAG: PHP domain-containing protein, partial [Oscillospiraceae bacterium]|nr:PHP domain-containing protein [Oscillospiraceae bacterium]
MEFYANLHLHSTHSDGVYSPAELVRIAKEEGYKALAISDHDTGSAYPELVKACQEEGMECIFAVEFSVLEPKDYHIVGFNFDPEYPPMKEYLEKMAIRQTDNTKKCFDEAVEKGDITGITWEEVLEFNKGIPWLCNNHIFNAMMDKGLIEESQYMNWFDKNFRYQRGKYPPIYDFLPLEELVKLVKAAGGFAVEYLSDRYMELIQYVVKEAKRLGMYYWIYDEYEFPSGSAGATLCQKYPEHMQKYLGVEERFMEMP